MSFYETYYTKNIEKLYYYQHQFDGVIGDNNIDYTIHENCRSDLTHLNVYSIDPEGCEDVDDAFSYYQERDKKYIAIHIADPTEYIKPFSREFNEIMKKAFTRYPSNRKPIHMMNNDILEKSTLHENNCGNIKKAITITTEFNKDDTIIFENTTICFSMIKVKTISKLSYTNIPRDNMEIETCLKLSEKIFPDMIYNNDKRIEVKFNTDKNPYLHQSSDEECSYKKMIAKFAIFSNNFIAFYLKSKLEEGHVIFRNCPAVNDNELVKSSTNFDEFMYYILSNSVCASYDNIKSKHGILQLDEYLHMTSPIRRSVDCVIHYLLKATYLDIPIPFDNKQICDIIDQSNIINRKMKKAQFKDQKFRFLHAVEYDLKENPHKSYVIRYYVSSYMRPYLNIILNNFDGKPMYLSYTLKVSIQEFDDSLIGISRECEIRNVNCCSFYDEGSIPELDFHVLQNILQE